MKDIIISNICKSYDNKLVLDNFSAILKTGEITALMAPSGAGKTTLLRILMGFEKPDSGSISGLDNIRISTVFQENRLCKRLDAIDNIRLVNSNISEDEALKALENIGLGDSAYQKVEEFSGGMCRRVAILRALMAEYDLLLLDEPFRELDIETKNIVMNDTLKRCQGHTVLLVTHDASELEAMGIKTCYKL